MKTTFRGVLISFVLAVTVVFAGNEPEGVLLRYQLGYNGTITLKIYSFGSLIRTLVNNESQSYGWQEIHWDGKNNSGVSVATGTYTYEITAVINGGNYIKTGSVQYIK